MTAELNRLKAALHAATPEADPDAKARALALAQESFATHQGSGNQTRPTDNRPEKRAGIFAGVRNMFSNFGLRPALLATSSLAVVGLGVMIILPQTPLAPSLGLKTPELVQNEPVPGDLVVSGLERTQDASPDLEKRLQAPVSLAEPLAKTQMAEVSRPAPTAQALGQPATYGLVGGSGNQDQMPSLRSPENTERFANEDANPLSITAQDPVSTFSIDVDTASYAFVRAALQNGQLPPVEAVRIEEMVNYFPYDYAAPLPASTPFSTAVSVVQTPWNADTKLVHIAIQGENPALEDRPPLDLVFLIDTSGSMHDANKLPLLKQSFRLLLSKLAPQDRVAMVTYAGSSGVVLEPTAADNRIEIMAALDRLQAGGSTAGQAGLQQAYGLAENMAAKGRVGRVILATDGDFNVGISEPEALKSYIKDKRDSGIYLSVLGFGRGNYNDALMQALAQNGNGTASYIDTLSEAQKVLVDQVSGALFPIANDVKIQVEFNPTQIAEYRLIGYETRALAREDFNNDKVDAGDIGAGHTVTAIYEVTPVGSPAIKSDPLRYQTAETSATGSAEAGYLKLRYKTPGSSTSQLIETPFNLESISPTQDIAFASAIAGFGQLLRSGKYLGDWGYDAAIALAVANKGTDPFGYRAEAVGLMRLAKSLSN